MAPGVSVRSFNQDGAAFLYNGTSVAAPVVSGAVALLAQAFPALSGSQIVEILLRSADDLGAPAPMMCSGAACSTSRGPFRLLAVSAAAAHRSALAAVLGGPLGDGGTLINALAAVPVRDAYQRPYSANLGRQYRRRPGWPAGGALAGAAVESAVTMAGRSVAAFALNGDNRNLWAGDRATMAAQAPGLAPGSGGVSGHVVLALADGPVLAAGQGERLAGLVQLADPLAGPAALITHDPGLAQAARPLGAGGGGGAQPLGASPSPPALARRCCRWRAAMVRCWRAGCKPVRSSASPAAGGRWR